MTRGPDAKIPSKDCTTVLPARPLFATAIPGESAALPSDCSGCRQNFIVAAFSAWFAAVPGSALAQVLPDAGRIQQQFEREAERLPAIPPRKPAAPVVDEAARPALVAPDSVTFPVKGFRFTRNSVFAAAELQPLLKDFIGRERSLADLQRAAEVITAYYRERGYFVARAYIPAQDIRDDMVEIMVLEGKLDSIKLKPANELRLRQSVVEETLRAALPANGVIREADLERGLLLLNDLPGIGVRSVISPGTAFGTSIITAEVSEGPLVSGGLDVDNFGNTFTGSYHLGATLNLNDPLGYGDFLTARLVGSSDSGYGRIAYQFPLGTSGLHLSGVYSATAYKLCCQFDALDARGDAQTATLILQYPFVRSRDFDLYGSLQYDARHYYDRTIAGTTDDKKTRLFTLGLNGDSRDFANGGGLTNFWFGLVSGRLDLDDWVPNRAVDAITARTQGSYGKAAYSLSRLQNLGAATFVYASLTGQFASKNLDSSEKFVLGGATGLRGYPTGEAAGDEGALLNLELRHNLLDSLQLSAFFDHGEIRLHKNPWTAWQGGNTRISNRYGLSDYGVAVNWYQSGTFVVRASAAQPIGKNPGRDFNGNNSDGSRNGSHVWVQMVKFM